MLPRMARTEQQKPSTNRIDYRWRVDLEEGFEQTSYIYDAEGHLKAIDYKVRRTPGAEQKPARREA